MAEENPGRTLSVPEQLVGLHDETAAESNIPIFVTGVSLTFVSFGYYLDTPSLYTYGIRLWRLLFRCLLVQQSKTEYHR
jgi:hypothetical protein